MPDKQAPRIMIEASKIISSHNPQLTGNQTHAGWQGAQLRMSHFQVQGLAFLVYLPDYCHRLVHSMEPHSWLLYDGNHLPPISPSTLTWSCHWGGVSSSKLRVCVRGVKEMVIYDGTSSLVGMSLVELSVECGSGLCQDRI
jgi:hypothetical protein